MINPDSTTSTEYLQIATVNIRGKLQSSLPFIMNLMFLQDIHILGSRKHEFIRLTLITKLNTHYIITLTLPLHPPPNIIYISPIMAFLKARDVAL